MFFLLPENIYVERNVFKTLPRKQIKEEHPDLNVSLIKWASNCSRLAKTVGVNERPQPHTDIYTTCTYSSQPTFKLFFSHDCLISGKYHWASEGVSSLKALTVIQMTCNSSSSSADDLAYLPMYLFCVLHYFLHVFVVPDCPVEQ